MTKFVSFNNRLMAFRDDTRGVFAFAFAVVSVVVMMLVGLGIDGARMFAAHSQLTQALDAAVTSTAREITLGAIKPKDAEKLVEGFVLANLEANNAITGRLTLDPVKLNSADKSVTASGHYDIDLLFPFFRVGKSTAVASTSTAAYSDKKIELAVMLDVTGSMAGDKLASMKTATKNLVQLLTDRNHPGNERIRIALVPYAQGVNVGTAGRLEESVYVEQSFLGGAFTAPKHGDYWGGIIAAGAGTFAKFLPDGSPRIDLCATERKGALEFSNDNPNAGLVNRDFRLNNCPSAAILPLTSNKTALFDRVDDFKASGGTAGHIGIQWTWYMLSREWRSFLPNTAEPAAKGGKVDKIAILMTDGEFNTAYAGNGTANYGGGGRVAQSEAKARQLCKEMKNDGIKVYTIGFQLGSTGAEKVLADCATPGTATEKFFYLASDGAALDAAFQEIARNVEKLRLVN